jgi:hypothetical protein
MSTWSGLQREARGRLKPATRTGYRLYLATCLTSRSSCGFATSRLAKVLIKREKPREAPSRSQCTHAEVYFIQMALYHRPQQIYKLSALDSTPTRSHQATAATACVRQFRGAIRSQQTSALLRRPMHPPIRFTSYQPSPIKRGSSIEPLWVREDT